jgi:sugar-specific transcriptional regulator TrmB
MVDRREAALRDLQALGFSSYEARVYLALLHGGRLKGYEAAKRSGVPRSMVYQVLGRLVDRGAAYRVEEGEGTFYGAVSQEELLARLEAEARERFARARESLI